MRAVEVWLADIETASRRRRGSDDVPAVEVWLADIETSALADGRVR